MNRDSNDIEQLIEAYVKGKLDGKAKADFELMMQKDALLAAEVEIQQLAFGVMLDADVLDLRTMMQNDLKSKTSGDRSKWWIGSALVLLVGTGLFIYLNNAIKTKYNQVKLVEEVSKK